MSLFDQLSSALNSAQHMLNGLGPEPKGDVAGMRALAKAIRAEAETVSTAGHAAGRLGRTVDFHGPAAQQFAGNAALVGGVIGIAVDQLEQAAQQVEREAAKIHREQEQWRRDRHRLEGAVASIAAQLRQAGR